LVIELNNQTEGNKMSKIAKAKRLAKEIGAEVQYEREIGTLAAFAPRGKQFVATQCHSCCHDFERGPWANEMLNDLIEDLQEGLEPCEQKDCDVCGEADE
jgi:hypothetical protein